MGSDVSICFLVQKTQKAGVSQQDDCVLLYYLAVHGCKEYRETVVLFVHLRKSSFENLIKIFCPPSRVCACRHGFETRLDGKSEARSFIATDLVFQGLNLNGGVVDVPAFRANVMRLLQNVICFLIVRKEVHA